MLYINYPYCQAGNMCNNWAGMNMSHHPSSVRYGRPPGASGQPRDCSGMKLKRAVRPPRCPGRLRSRRRPSRWTQQTAARPAAAGPEQRHNLSVTRHLGMCMSVGHFTVLLGPGCRPCLPPQIVVHSTIRLCTVQQPYVPHASDVLAQEKNRAHMYWRMCYRRQQSIV